jgi:hypothetical protein
MTNDAVEKSFAPKLFVPDQPDHSWDIERLGVFAREKHEAILQGERSLAPLYWFLGMALEIARNQIGRGPWGKKLVEWGINKVRACRARSIFRTFSSPEALSGLSVEDAFKQRQRRQVHACRKRRAEDGDDQAAKQPTNQASREKGSDDLEAFLDEIRTRADDLLDAAAFAERERRRSLRPLYEAALERLRQLGRVLGADDEPRLSKTSLKPPGKKGRKSATTVLGHGEDTGCLV